MKYQINFKRLIPASFLVIIIDMIIGNLLHMNPIVSDIYAKYSTHQYIKPMEESGFRVFKPAEVNQ